MDDRTYADTGRGRGGAMGDTPSTRSHVPIDFDAHNARAITKEQADREFINSNKRMVESIRILNAISSKRPINHTQITSELNYVMDHIRHMLTVAEKSGVAIPADMYTTISQANSAAHDAADKAGTGYKRNSRNRDILEAAAQGMTEQDIGKNIVDDEAKQNIEQFKLAFSENLKITYEKDMVKRDEVEKTMKYLLDDRKEYCNLTEEELRALPKEVVESVLHKSFADVAMIQASIQELEEVAHETSAVILQEAKLNPLLENIEFKSAEEVRRYIEENHIDENGNCHPQLADLYGQTIENSKIYERLKELFSELSDAIHSKDKTKKVAADMGVQVDEHKVRSEIENRSYAHQRGKEIAQQKTTNMLEEFQLHNIKAQEQEVKLELQEAEFSDMERDFQERDEHLLDEEITTQEKESKVNEGEIIKAQAMSEACEIVEEFAQVLDIDISHIEYFDRESLNEVIAQIDQVVEANPEIKNDQDFQEGMALLVDRMIIVNDSYEQEAYITNYAREEAMSEAIEITQQFTENLGIDTSHIKNFDEKSLNELMAQINEIAENNPELRADEDFQEGIELLAERMNIINSGKEVSNNREMANDREVALPESVANAASKSSETRTPSSRVDGASVQGLNHAPENSRNSIQDIINSRNSGNNSGRSI